MKTDLINFNAFSDEADPSLQGQIRALERNHYQGMEIRGVNGKNVTKLTTDEAKEIRKKLDDAGLSVWSIGSPIGKIKLTDDFEEHKELFRHTLELADILGAKRFRLFSFFPEKESNFDLVENESIDKLGQLLEIGRHTGIVFCHENEKGIFGDIARRCVKIHKALPELKAVFDPANFIQCGQNTLEAWEMLHNYVDYFHVKDAFSDQTVVGAGEGEGHLDVLLKSYFDQGGSHLTLEPHLKVFKGFEKLEDVGGLKSIRGFETSEEAFDYAVNALNKLLEKI